MRPASILTVMISLALCIGVAGASTGWESNYDILWNITVADKCSGEEVTYYNCILVNQEFFWISFIPDQSRVGEPRGKQIRVSTNGCTAVLMEEAE